MKNKVQFLIGSILSLLALTGIFITDLIFYLMSSGTSIIPIINLIFTLACVIFTIVAMVLCLTTKNVKSAYVIVIPAVMMNMFLHLNSFFSEGHILIWYLLTLVLILGSTFLLLGVFASLQTKNEQKQENTPPQSQEFDKELQRLFQMKNDGLITEEEFDQLKMRIISRELK